eukprot:Sspe_Gene.28790::Locus_13234_Transcript_1_1_Confidence_1.000_Length_2562::g.28790::m.28790
MASALLSGDLSLRVGGPRTGVDPRAVRSGGGDDRDHGRDQRVRVLPAVQAVEGVLQVLLGGGEDLRNQEGGQVPQRRLHDGRGRGRGGRRRVDRAGQHQRGHRDQLQGQQPWAGEVGVGGALRRKPDRGVCCLHHPVRKLTGGWVGNLVVPGGGARGCGDRRYCAIYRGGGCVRHVRADEHGGLRGQRDQREGSGGERPVGQDVVEAGRDRERRRPARGGGAGGVRDPEAERRNTRDVRLRRVVQRGGVQADVRIGGCGVLVGDAGGDGGVGVAGPVELPGPCVRVDVPAGGVEGVRRVRAGDGGEVPDGDLPPLGPRRSRRSQATRRSRRKTRTRTRTWGRRRGLRNAGRSSTSRVRGLGAGGRQRGVRAVDHQADLDHLPVGWASARGRRRGGDAAADDHHRRRVGPGVDVDP